MTELERMQRAVLSVLPADREITLNEAVSALRQRLDEPDRTIFELWWLHGLTHREISHRINRSRECVTKRLHKIGMLLYSLNIADHSGSATSALSPSKREVSASGSPAVEEAWQKLLAKHPELADLPDPEQHPIT